MAAYLLREFYILCSYLIFNIIIIPITWCFTLEWIIFYFTLYLSHSDALSLSLYCSNKVDIKNQISLQSNFVMCGGWFNWAHCFTPSPTIMKNKLAYWLTNSLIGNSLNSWFWIFDPMLRYKIYIERTNELLEMRFVMQKSIYEYL